MTDRICRWGLGIILILGASCAPSGPVIRVESSVSALQVGETAGVHVTADEVADLIAFEAHLSFDATILEVIELKEGDFIEADFVVQRTFDNAAGTIDYAVTQIDRPPANGSGVLLEIVFRAKARGQSPVRFRATEAAPEGVLLSDSSGQAIPAPRVDGSIEVSE